MLPRFTVRRSLTVAITTGLTPDKTPLIKPRCVGGVAVGGWVCLVGVASMCTAGSSVSSIWVGPSRCEAGNGGKIRGTLIRSD